jgi:pyruvyltransferase
VTLLTWLKPNVGDALSRFIVDAVAGRPVVTSVACTSLPRNSEACLLAVGSILHRAIAGDIVWGSGLGNHLKSARPWQAPRPLRVLAVRGPLTRNLLLEQAVDCPAVFGDPALLLPKLYQPPSIAPRGTVVVPHVYDTELAAAFPEAELLDPRGDPFDIVDRLATSQLVISSSLHGVIIAEAYGVPAVLHLPLRPREPSFKFDDYYASTGRDRVRCQFRGGTVAAAEAFGRQLPPPVFPDLERLATALRHYFA